MQTGPLYAKCRAETRREGCSSPIRKRRPPKDPPKDQRLTNTSASRRVYERVSWSGDETSGLYPNTLCLDVRKRPLLGP